MRRSRVSPRSCSGDMYGTVPTTPPVLRQSHIARQLGQPEVDDLHLAIGQQHDVGGLDVAMNDAQAVRLRQSLAPPARRC